YGRARAPDALPAAGLLCRRPDRLQSKSNSGRPGRNPDAAGHLKQSVNAAARRIAAACCCRAEAPATVPAAKAGRPPFPDRKILAANDPARAGRARQILLAEAARERFDGRLAQRLERAAPRAVC